MAEIRVSVRECGACENIAEIITNAVPGDRIVFEKGEYRFGKTAALEGIHDITIDGGDSVFTGTMVVEGEFRPYRDGIFAVKTDAGLDIQEVFVDGVKYIMARYPDYDESKRLGGYSSDVIGHLRNLKHIEGGYVRALHSSEWGGNDYIIEGRDEDGSPVLKWIGDNNRGNGYHREFLMAENLMEELDSEKEWFYDRQTGVLYIIPEKGTELNNSVIEATVCGELFRFTDCSGISIKNVHFSKTKRMMFCSEYEKITRSDWCIAKNAAVYFEHCSDCAVSDCTFDNIGGNCVFIHNKNKGISVSGCEFTDCGASGVCVFGNQKCVRDLSTWEDHHTDISDKTPGPAGDDFPSDISISGCYFYNLGIYEKQSSAVTVSVAEGVTVKGCTIHHLPRAGLNVCDGSFGGHLFEDNLVFDTVRETGDHGPFNSWGRDRYWSYGGFDTSGNNGTIKRPYATLDAVSTTVIRHNMFVGERGFGIDLDDGSSNYLIENNFCVGVGIKLREGFLRTVRNNLIVSAPFDIHCVFDLSDDLVENNIIVNRLPVNTIICNHEKNTTAVRDNLFVGADEKNLVNELVGKYPNAVCDTADEALMRGITDKIPFVPFSFEFGRKDKPKPDIVLPKTQKHNEIKKLGAVLTAVDDSVRSMAGLPDYRGAFVSDISADSILYEYGIRKEDVILSINGEKVEKPETIPEYTDISSAVVSRAQKVVEIKA